MNEIQEALVWHIENNYEAFDDEGNNYLNDWKADALAYEFMSEFFIEAFDKSFVNGNHDNLYKKEK